jgi:hypothetical protein
LDRRSFTKPNYYIDPESGRPLNPMGRTGVTGRANLGRKNLIENFKFFLK